MKIYTVLKRNKIGSAGLKVFEEEDLAYRFIDMVVSTGADKSIFYVQEYDVISKSEFEKL